MANKTRQIQIQSILGGQSPTTHFATSDQFYLSLGIDPSKAIVDTIASNNGFASGLLRPTPATEFGSGVLQKSPYWIKSSPKEGDQGLYVYDAQGSAYTTRKNNTFTALSDGGALSNSSGNGLAYYDNYMYFAKDTTIARYGPLNGTPAFNGDYWVTTLSKTALIDTQYPSNFTNGLEYPNHFLHRHSDGRLYIADVVGNKGTLHYIKTSKTTVEGDTNDGSTYIALQFGYGLWPTALESYGSDLVIALFENDYTGVDAQMPAKIGFWDTNSTNVNQIIWVEFPDSLITAIKNVNGVLYVISGDRGRLGFRVSRYVGGYSFQEVNSFEYGSIPFPGAVDGRANNLVFGSNTVVPETSPCVYSIGLPKEKLSDGLFNIMRGTSMDSSACATAIAFSNVSNSVPNRSPILGWGGTGIQGIDGQISDYSNAPSVWQSQTYKIGQPFKITKIRIPLAQAMAANMIITPKVYVDESSSGTALTTINNTAYPSKKNIVIRPQNLTGDHSFILELRWTGSALCTVGLPITIEYEVIDD